MIREANIEDISAINEIGLRIDTNFASIYKLLDVLNQNYSKIYVYEDVNIIKGFLHIENHYEITDIINIAVLKCFENNKIYQCKSNGIYQRKNDSLLSTGCL